MAYRHFQFVAARCEHS